MLHAGPEAGRRPWFRPASRFGTGPGANGEASTAGRRRESYATVRNRCDCWRSGVEGVPDQGTLLLLLLLLLGGMIQPNDQDPRDG